MEEKRGGKNDRPSADKGGGGEAISWIYLVVSKVFGMQLAQFISGLLVYVTLMYFLMENIKERERERKSGRNFEKSFFLEDDK